MSNLEKAKKEFQNMTGRQMDALEAHAASQLEVLEQEALTLETEWLTSGGSVCIHIISAIASQIIHNNHKPSNREAIQLMTSLALKDENLESLMASCTSTQIVDLVKSLHKLVPNTLDGSNTDWQWVGLAMSRKCKPINLIEVL